MHINFIKDFLRYKKYQYINFKKHHFNFKKDISISSYISEIKKNGYVCVENYISKEICEKIKIIIDEYIHKNPEMTWSDKLGSDVRIHGAENISQEMKNMVINKINFTKKIGQQYSRRNIDLYMMMANRITFKQSNLGSGQGWHKDSYSTQFKSILYLNDVDENNGPFQIIKNSTSNIFMLKLFYNLKKKFPSTRFSELEIKKITKNYQISEITGKAGTLILVDTSYLHRGKPLSKKNACRYALTNYFFPKIDFKNHENHFIPLIKIKN